MRHDRVGKRAVQRSRYTGETWEQARSALVANRPPIPVPEGTEQLHFEADVFDHLLKSRFGFTEFAFGLRRVRPELDRITLEVESYLRAAEILGSLLPVYEPGGEVHGLNGLRIRQHVDRGLELHQLGRVTSLRLTGLPAASWRRIERDLLDRSTDLGWNPVWRQRDDWTAQEQAMEQRWYSGDWTSRSHAAAWCTSGLLRRTALFHTALATDFVSGYRGLPIRGYEDQDREPVRWCIDLDHRPGAPHLADDLVSALTDADYGLPIAPARHLDAVYGTPPQNVLRLDDADRTALVELRFGTYTYSGDPDDAALFERIHDRVDRMTADRPSAPET